MMEDLAPAEQGDQIRGCSVDQATLAATELVKLHAPRWADPSLADLLWLQAGDPEEAAEIGSAFFGQLFPAFVDRYRSRLAGEHIVVGEKLQRNFKNWTLGYRGPATIIHRDYRLDNMLFGGARGVTVVDWQTPSLGAGASDLAYFIGAGLLPDLRRSSEHDLVRTYHHGLCERGVTGYDFSDCWNDYRRYSFSGYIMAVVASMIVGQTQRGDDMFMVMAGRHAQQVIDLDAYDFL